MAEIYKRIDDLLEVRGLSGAKMCADLDMSRSFMTELRKGRVRGLTLDTAGKIADYLGIPVNYLSDQGPFEGWELINQNRAGFLHYVDVPKNVQYALWGIDLQDPDRTPLINFINFIADAVISAEPTSEGDWIVEIKDAFKPQKNAPTVTGKGAVSDADIKFALFGNAEIDDEVLDEVKRFAKFAIEQKEQRKQSD